MRKKLSILAGLLFVAGLAAAAPQINQPAPAFAGEGSDGKTYALKDFKGKYVVLEWYNKDCPFIHKHYDSGNMQRIQELYAKKGVIWLEIVSSAPGKEGDMTPVDAQANRNMVGTKSLATVLDGDGKIGRLYGAKTTPHMFVINPKGILIYKGAIDDHPTPDPNDIPRSMNYVALALDQAMAGKPVAIATTRPYGCSVKYK